MSIVALEVQLKIEMLADRLAETEGKPGTVAAGVVSAKSPAHHGGGVNAVVVRRICY